MTGRCGSPESFPCFSASPSTYAPPGSLERTASTLWSKHRCIHNHLDANLSTHGLDTGLFLFAPYAHDILTIFTSPAAPHLAHSRHLRAVRFPQRMRRLYLSLRSMSSSCAHSTCTRMERAISTRPLERTTPTGARAKTPTPTCPNGSSRRRPAAVRPNPPLYSRESRELLLALAKAKDARLPDPLTEDDVQCGRYLGYSAMKQLAFDWMMANPQISAVRGADESSEGDADAGEDFTAGYDAPCVHSHRRPCLSRRKLPRPTHPRRRE
ncbi:hypothetical protein C8J57DRAFT_1382501 [Mycena rebaudengoi]|nr:hypothetical protein C8J57DRAFT_1382501 [Mycena rebaudengoi]